MTASFTLYFLQGEDIKTCLMFDDGPRLSIVLAVKKLVRYYLIYDHEFTSLILPTLKYQSILHVRKWTTFLSSACGQKTRQNTSLYMLQV